jgi:ketosteroid isomerase-like protein
VLLYVVLLSVLLAGCRGEPAGEGANEDAGAVTLDRAAEADSIRSLLSAQQAAWNRGDLEAFMQGYARTDTLRFASGGSVRTGWQTTLDNYREGYPDRAAMGRLAFSDLDVEVMSPAWAMVFGRWQLQRENDAPGGLFTLIVHRDAPEAPWRIVHDHTSSGGS